MFNFNAEPLTATDYRKIEVRCYDVSGTDGKLLSENLIGQRSIYLLCPGATGDRVSFISTAPEMFITEEQDIFILQVRISICLKIRVNTI